MMEEKSTSLLVEMISNLASFLDEFGDKPWPEVEGALKGELGLELQRQDWDLGKKIWDAISRKIPPDTIKAFAREPDLQSNIDAIADDLKLAQTRDENFRTSLIALFKEALEREAFDASGRMRSRLPNELQNVEQQLLTRPRVFLRHASEDTEIVNALVKILNEHDIDVVNDEQSIESGDFIFGKLQDALGKCSHFVPLLSPNSINRPWVDLEINAAIQLNIRKQAPFIPVVYGLAESEIPPLIAAFKCLLIDDTLDGAYGLIEKIRGVRHIPKEEIEPAKGAGPLPPRPAHFVGRGNEIRELIRMLAERHPSPAAILGGPGMGKSTLCWRVVHEDSVIRRYGDRRYFVRLDSVHSADDMVAQIAATLGIDISDNPLKAVVGKMSEESTLLVLDNVETPWLRDVIRSEDVLFQLSQVVGSTFLAILRGRDVPEGPQWGCRIHLQPLTDAQSKELFLAHVAEDDEKKAETFSDDEQQLDQLIQLLSGLPLAVELLATRAHEATNIDDLRRRWQTEKRKLLVPTNELRSIPLQKPPPNGRIADEAIEEAISRYFSKSSLDPGDGQDAMHVLSRLVPNDADFFWVNTSRQPTLITLRQFHENCFFPMTFRQLATQVHQVMTEKNQVYINCPYDNEYMEYLDAMSFTIQACGFTPRCAQESLDSGVTRVDKIFEIISEANYGIHDLCRVSLSSSGFPRFNMPFELGIFLGARKYGGKKHERKSCIVLDIEGERYKEYISDISGQDIHCYGSNLGVLVVIIRNFLSKYVPYIIPEDIELFGLYCKYRGSFDKICSALNISEKALSFSDRRKIIYHFLAAYKKSDRRDVDTIFKVINNI